MREEPSKITPGQMAVHHVEALRVQQSREPSGERPVTPATCREIHHSDVFGTELVAERSSPPGGGVDQVRNRDVDTEALQGAAKSQQVELGPTHPERFDDVEHLHVEISPTRSPRA